MKARLAGEKALRELDQPIHTEKNKRKPKQPKRHANLRRFANRVYPGQFAGAFESAECNRNTLHGHQSPRRSHYHPSSRINQRGQRNQHKVNHLLPYRQIRRDFPTVLPPSSQEIFEKRVTLVRHGYPEWLGYSILSVYRYRESALETHPKPLLRSPGTVEVNSSPIRTIIGTIRELLSSARTSLA